MLIYRYRERFQEPAPALRNKIESAKQYYRSEYYDQVEVAIKLDQRWRNEMSAEDLSVFNDVAGDLNESYS